MADNFFNRDIYEFMLEQIKYDPETCIFEENIQNSLVEYLEINFKQIIIKQFKIKREKIDDISLNMNLFD